MSYGLTFYTISYKGLRDEILKPSDDFLKKLQETWKTVYDPGAGESFETALDEGLAELKKAVAENKTQLSTKGELAFVAAIETYGQELGTLEHSSSGGEEFREEFLEGVAAKTFNFPHFGKYLTNRPLFGFKTLEYPSWGGFLHGELLKLQDYDSASTGNEDFKKWFADLAIFIKQAKDSGKDLLTIYR